MKDLLEFLIIVSVIIFISEMQDDVSNSINRRHRSL